MKKNLLISLFVLVFACTAYAQDYTIGRCTIAFSITPELQWPDTDCDCMGLHIGLGGELRNVYGLSVELVNIYTQDHLGLQVGLVNIVGGESMGLDVSLVQVQKGDMYGCQIDLIGINDANVNGFLCGLLYSSTGLEMNGVQLGVVTSSDQLNGVQIGGINTAQEANGVQIGLVNYAYDMQGVQIGLINVIAKSSVKFFPLINFRF